MILFLDTTDFENLVFAVVGSNVFRRAYKGDARKSFQLLGFLEKFFKAAGIKSPQSQITEVCVCSGPGSYTGVRIGVAASQALGFAWQVPVKAIEKAKVPSSLLELKKIKGRFLFK